MTTTKSLLLLAFCTALGACGEGEALDGEERGGLMFGLDPEDVEQIHAAYLPDEDIELTTARLTAPFDCALYGDLCDLAGPGGAKVLTGETIDMALGGADPEAIDDFIGVRLDELSSDRDDEEAFDQPRAFGTWRTANLSGISNLRVRIRSGIISPVVGQHRARTLLQAEARSGNSNFWYPTAVERLCVSAGLNAQTRIDTVGENSPVETVIELRTTRQNCRNNTGFIYTETLHARNYGVTIPATPQFPETTRVYELSSQGSGTGTVNGQSFTVTSPGRIEFF